MRIAGCPALTNSRWTEIDVLGVAFPIELWRQQTNDVHLRGTTVAGQLTHRRVVPLCLRQTRDELIDDVAKAVCLLHQMTD